MRLLIIILAFTTFIPSAFAQTYGEGYLETVNELPVLHLKGTPYEMGKQYGYLAGDRIAAAVKLIQELATKKNDVGTLPAWMVKPIRKIIGWVFWREFPNDSKEQIKGIIAGAKKRSPAVKLSKYDVAFLNSIIDLVGIVHMKSSFLERPQQEILKILGIDWLKTNCDSFAAWGPRTQGGKTFQTRNVDIPTGLGFEHFPLVIVYKPEGKIPYVTATFSGLIGMFTGMNAYGLGLGQIWAFSQDRAMGTPWQLQMAKVFSEARTAAEAVELYRKQGNRTYGSNFVFADAQGGGLAVESSPRYFEVFRDDDPKEDLALWNGEPYAIRMKDAVFRGDCALDPKLRARQTASNGPKGDPRTSGAYQKRYKGQADRIKAYEDAGVLIGKEEAEVISRETAIRNGSIQATVYANTDLEMWVSYARIKEDGSVEQAYEGVYHHVPFSSYLDESYDHEALARLKK